MRTMRIGHSKYQLRRVTILPSRLSLATRCSASLLIGRMMLARFAHSVLVQLTLTVQNDSVGGVSSIFQKEVTSSKSVQLVTLRTVFATKTSSGYGVTAQNLTHTQSKMTPEVLVTAQKQELGAMAIQISSNGLSQTSLSLSASRQAR